MYCSMIFFLCNDRVQNWLQILWNRAMTIMLQWNRFSNVKGATWLAVKEKLTLDTMTFIHEIINNLWPKYFWIKLCITRMEVNLYYNFIYNSKILNYIIIGVEQFSIRLDRNEDNCSEGQPKNMWYKVPTPRPQKVLLFYRGIVGSLRLTNNVLYSKMSVRGLYFIIGNL